MIVEIGHFALVLALCAALTQAIVPFWGARVGDPDLMAVGRNAGLTQFALVAAAFAALVHAHLTSDFSVLNVAENSHSAVPTIYKISGVWGNHEGSNALDRRSFFSRVHWVEPQLVAEITYLTWTADGARPNRRIWETEFCRHRLSAAFRRK